MLYLHKLVVGVTVPIDIT